MTKNRLPRISAALLAGAFAVVPVAASVALAPSAAAIAHVEGEEVETNPVHDELGIAPLSLDLDDADADVQSDVEFIDEDGNVVDRDVDVVDRSELNRRGIDPLTEDAEPVSLEIAPISAEVGGGLPTAAIVAIAAGGVAVVGAGAGLGLRARKAKA
ncbi:hypothetical protein [Xylanimonas protaetiae]|uniref:Gram-positive cocci surface proteins LPxTG domain-containing protein n=1 Tax=Xylanimonas protaetiae TaxID=2509457 RepID=A0A4P6F055_9MICO|nr:hypothetical protein [Xylanimonas protaetiae]QAY68832.1 hypothetical protein ET471_01195 [Xylanimonas protaetiae]